MRLSGPRSGATQRSSRTGIRSSGCDARGPLPLWPPLQPPRRKRPPQLLACRRRQMSRRLRGHNETGSNPSRTLERSCSRPHRRNGHAQYLEIESDRPPIDVLPIHADHFLEVHHVAAPIYLPQPCDSRFYAEPQEVVVLIVDKVVLEERARTDERHLAGQDVEELRELVETPLPQEPTHT